MDEQEKRKLKKLEEDTTIALNRILNKHYEEKVIPKYGDIMNRNKKKGGSNGS